MPNALTLGTNTHTQTYNHTHTHPLKSFLHLRFSKPTEYVIHCNWTDRRHCSPDLSKLKCKRYNQALTSLDSTNLVSSDAKISHFDNLKISQNQDNQYFHIVTLNLYPCQKFSATQDEVRDPIQTNRPILMRPIEQHRLLSDRFESGTGVPD